MLLLVALAAPLAAEAQQPGKVYRIGMLFHTNAPTDPNLIAFREGLRALGWVEGQNYVLEPRFRGRADGSVPGPRRRSGPAQGGRHRDFRPAPTQAAKAATTTIPIVFGIGTNPFKTGLITSLSRPVGNATGVWFLTGDLESKRLGLLHELVPNGALIAVLFNPRNLNTATESKQLQVDAYTLGQPIHILHASSDPADGKSTQATIACR